MVNLGNVLVVSVGIICFFKGEVRLFFFWMVGLSVVWLKFLGILLVIGILVVN